MDINNNLHDTNQNLQQEKKISWIIRWILNGLIIILLIGIGYHLKLLVEADNSTPSESITTLLPIETPSIIQVDVLNACGVKGIAAKVTRILRQKGFDVVEIRNYKTTHLKQTLVVDRVGNLETARRVALALGISDSSIIQQINPDYFVDVSVIIGGDYNQLKNFQDTLKEGH